MNAIPISPPRPLTRSSARLLLTLLLVLIAHALLLSGAPGFLASSLGRALQPDFAPQLSFITRVVAADSGVSPVTQPLRAAPLVTKTAPEASLPATPILPAVTAATVVNTTSTGIAALETPPFALPAITTAAAPESSVLVKLAPEPDDAKGLTLKAATPSTGNSQPQPTKPVAAALAKSREQASFPDSVRLEYDGRGQEKGFISYVGSADLIWTRQADKYETKLEISAFGIRLVTWTSKGALGPAGLEPIRFGDRRRSPEVATHFQRDKGLITYSSNRPDVPLQAGAQDKLSALLQLTALVSGGPQQYPAGSKIEFQATDAYRAEIWSFHGGAPEKMALPGGTLTVIGFVKNPTVDFDQKIEVWLAPEISYLPVRLRITEANGTYSDLQWRKTIKPE